VRSTSRVLAVVHDVLITLGAAAATQNGTRH